MSATFAALEVIEASLDEQLNDWRAGEIWRDWIENMKAGVRVDRRGRVVELNRVQINVPWRWKKRMRLAVERWAARKAVEQFKSSPRSKPLVETPKSDSMRSTRAGNSAENPSNSTS